MKRIIIISIAVVLQMLFLTSCLTTRQTNLLQKPGGGVPSYPPMSEPVEEYKVRMGDQLMIFLTINPMDVSTTQLFSFFSVINAVAGESSRSFPVKTDGTIYFPYLGDIYVRGLTTLEIQQLMEKLINENISSDCIVKVFLENRYYSVIGESRAARYNMPKEQMTIHQALAQSHDINPFGDRRRVKIIRQMEEGTVIKVFDLRSRDIVNSEFYYIQPNDIIYIQPLGRRFLGLDSFGAVFAILSTAATVGLIIYNFVK